MCFRSSTDSNISPIYAVLFKICKKILIHIYLAEQLELLASCEVSQKLTLHFTCIHFHSGECFTLDYSRKWCNTKLDSYAKKKPFYKRGRALYSELKQWIPMTILFITSGRIPGDGCLRYRKMRKDVTGISSCGLFAYTQYYTRHVVVKCQLCLLKDALDRERR